MMHADRVVGLLRRSAMRRIRVRRRRPPRACRAPRAARAEAAPALRRTLPRGNRAAARGNPTRAPMDRRSYCTARRARPRRTLAIAPAPAKQPPIQHSAKRERAATHRGALPSIDANREDGQIVAQTIAAARAHLRHQFVGELLRARSSRARSAPSRRARAAGLRRGRAPRSGRRLPARACRRVRGRPSLVSNGSSMTRRARAR